MHHPLLGVNIRVAPQNHLRALLEESRAFLATTPYTIAREEEAAIGDLVRRLR